MIGKQILITGGTSGIGLAATEALAPWRKHHHVGRNETRTKIAAAHITTTMLWHVAECGEGGRRSVWLATSADVVKTSGGYYVDMEWRSPNLQGQCVQTAREISEAQYAGSSTEARR